MGLGTQAGLPLGVVFTSPFCILLPQALQAFYRPKKGLTSSADSLSLDLL